MPTVGDGSVLLARRHIFLAARPSSAAQARKVLRRLLVETDHEQWIDAAALACTELVSNAILHANSTIELTLELRPGELRVEVRDANPTLPVQRSYGSEATTGRGMALVAALSNQHGICDAGQHGKTVWFTLSESSAPRSDEELLAAWNDPDWDPAELSDLPPSRSTHLVSTIRLRALPPALWFAARQHHDALLRELVLYRAEHAELDLDLAAADHARQATAAVASKLPEPQSWTPEPVDVEVDVDSALGPAFGALQEALDTAEWLALSGRLLERPGLPEVIAVRDWLCQQVMGQLAGVPPAAWPGTAQERFTTSVNARPEDVLEAADLARVRDSTRPVVAADDANRIVAVSQPLAQLLGWDANELTGRRLVSLIPPRLREAHVAGFARHLSTGETRVLGVALALPVLRADGREISCRLLIEHTPWVARASFYVGWFDPMPF